MIGFNQHANLRRKKIKGGIHCKLCGKEETTSHILFTSPIAVFAYMFLVTVFHFNRGLIFSFYFCTIRKCLS
jgi:hypothetical protein